MKLIVGLGNPGRRYQKTRHNVGFEVLDAVAARNSAEPSKEKFSGYVAGATVAGHSALLVWPQTLMNRSGQSVAAAVGFYQVPLEDLLVVCDDFNLPLGKLRFRGRGSAGGQKGLDDIIRRLGSEEFARLRVGIGPVPDRWDPADYVLSRCTAAERALMDDMIAQAADAVECWVAEGLEAGMNRFN
jgi:PTH1 family peptidyl-tRNA hydrolase